MDAFLHVKSLIGQQERTSKGSAMNKTSAGGPGPGEIKAQIAPSFPSALNYKAWHSENAMPAATGTCLLSLSTSIFTADGHLTHVFLVDTCQTYVFTNLWSFHWPRYQSLIAKQQGEQQADPLPEAHKNATQDGHSNHLKGSKSHRTQTGDQLVGNDTLQNRRSQNHQCIIIHRSPIHTHIYNYMYTYSFSSSTAQGGGGSFKNRKPIGEVGCCESGMAERSHSWIEMWLSVSAYLSIYHLSIYLSVYLSICLLWYFMCFAPQQRALFHLSSGQLAPHPPL